MDWPIGAYTKRYFTGGMTTISRSESMNNFFLSVVAATKQSKNLSWTLNMHKQYLRKKRFWLCHSQLVETIDFSPSLRSFWFSNLHKRIVYSISSFQIDEYTSKKFPDCQTANTRFMFCLKKKFMKIVEGILL